MLKAIALVALALSLEGAFVLHAVVASPGARALALSRAGERATLVSAKPERARVSGGALAAAR